MSQFDEEEGPSDDNDEIIEDSQQPQEAEDNNSTVSTESQNIVILESKISDKKNGSTKSVEEIFKERIQLWKKSIMKNMTLSDKLDFRDPQNVSEFTQEIYKNMIREENQNMVDHEYLQKVQTEIKDTSRAFLIEWIIDVHRKFRLLPEALYVTVYIIDQYMSKQKIQKNQLHLLGVSTLWIASKYEEIYPPDLNEFLQVSENKFSRQQVLDMEKEILHKLNFMITVPSAYRFLQRYRRLSGAFNNDEVFFYAQYLMEISLLDATLLRFKPSQLAAASLILSSRQLSKKNSWNREVE